MGSSISVLLFQPPDSSYELEDGRFFQLLTRRKQSIGAFFIDLGESHTILFSHGNAEDIGLIWSWFREVGRILRVNIMAYDYTGYGINTNSPSEEDCFADIEAAMDYLTVVRGIRPSKIILWGRSLGSGPTCHLAKKYSEKEPVAGVILQSPLMSAYRVAFHFRYSLFGDKFCNIDMVQHIRCPVLILHGTHDEIVPFWHGQELYLAVPKQFRFAPYWVQDAGHNNLETVDMKDFFRRIGYFLDVIA